MWIRASFAVLIALPVWAPCSAVFSSGVDRPPHFACADGGTLVLKGNSDAGGLKGAFGETLDLADGRYAVKRDYGAYAEAEGFDGRTAWAQDRSRASHPFDSTPARAITVSQAWLRRRGWCDARGFVSERRPDETNGGKTREVWRATPESGIPVLLRFGGGRLRESEIQLWSNRLIRHYSDWRSIGGIQVAFVERDDDPEDESSETITLARARLQSVRRDAALFAQPSRPDDYGISRGSSATVPYEDDGIGRIYVPVLIDGSGPFPFEIDTGGHLIFTRETAAKLHLSNFGHQTSTGGGTGVAQETNVSVHELSIGDAFIRNQTPRVVPLSQAGNDRGPRSPRAGILGLELFERFAVELNRNTKTVTLTPLEVFDVKPRGVALPIRFTEDAPLTQGTFAGIAGDFEIDSGDAGPAIVEGYWAAQNGLGAQLRHGLDWTGGGVGGEYHETLTRGNFTLGALGLPHQVVSHVGEVSRGAESTHLQAGVIGESSLYRYDMTFDYGREMIWIDPAPKLPERPFNRAGLRLRRDTPDALGVTIVVPNSPGAEAGIVPGDRILAVAGKSAATLSATDASLLFTAAVGSVVDLTVAPKSGGAPRHLQIHLKELLP